MLTVRGTLILLFNFHLDTVTAFARRGPRSTRNLHITDDRAIGLGAAPDIRARQRACSPTTAH
jgi:hypothetical protein